MPTFEFPQFRRDVVQLGMARRALRSVLVALDVETEYTTVDSLLTLLDYFHEHPTEYKEIIYDSI